MAEATALRNNACPFPIYGAPWTVVLPIIDADGDLVSGATGLDSEVSKNGDTFADCTNEATEIATNSGMYFLTLTGAEMTADIVSVIVKTSSSGAKTTPLTFYPKKLAAYRAGTAQGGTSSTITLDSGADALDDFYNGMLCVGTLDGTVEARIISDYNGSTKVATVVPDWVTTPDSNDTFVLYIIDPLQLPNVNTTHAAGVTWNSGAIQAATVADGTIDAGTFAASAITATAIATGAITPAKLSYVIRTATAQGGAATTITLDASASAVDDLYNFEIIQILSGTGAGQARFISDYVGATKVATVPTWVTNPDNTSVFAIWAFGAIPGATAPTAAENADAVWDEARAGHVASGSFGEYVPANVTHFGGTAGTFASGIPETKVASIANNAIAAAAIASDAITAAKVADGTIDAATFASGAITASAIAANALTAAKIATDAIGATQLAADAVTEIQSGLSTLTAAGVRSAVGLASANLDTQLDALPTAAENAAALLDITDGVETSITPRQAFRLILAAAAGKLSGAATTTIVIRNVGDTKDRITATVDANGNRSAVTTDAT